MNSDHLYHHYLPNTGFIYGCINKYHYQLKKKNLHNKNTSLALKYKQEKYEPNTKYQNSFFKTPLLICKQ